MFNNEMLLTAFNKHQAFNYTLNIGDHFEYGNPIRELHGYNIRSTYPSFGELKPNIYSDSVVGECTITSLYVTNATFYIYFDVDFPSNANNVI